MTNPSRINPNRNELWLLRFDPVKGAEIGKTRPAVVVNPRSVGKLPQRIVVPITQWNSKYTTVPWLVHLQPTDRNGLSKESAVDCFQVKSVSTNRFVSKLGILRADELEEISAAIMICVGV